MKLNDFIENPNNPSKRHEFTVTANASDGDWDLKNEQNGAWYDRY